MRKHLVMAAMAVEMEEEEKEEEDGSAQMVY